MKVYESRVRKCKDVSIILDKKLRERRMEYEKYIISLSERNPFEVDEFVNIVSKNDFNKLRDMINSLRKERNLIQQQVTELQAVVDVQKSLFEKVNFDKIGPKNKKVSGS